MLQRRVAAAQLAYETALQILTAGEREGRENERAARNVPVYNSGLEGVGQLMRRRRQRKKAPAPKRAPRRRATASKDTMLFT